MRLPAARAQSTPILQRAIPSSGEMLPVLGLGTSRTFDVPVEQLHGDLRQVLQQFFQLGGRLVDTSPMYGHAEDVVGILAEQLQLTPQLFFATKVWTTGQQAGIEQMRTSMERLRTPRIDLMQVHNLVDTETHLQTLREWKAQKRVRYIGVTHYRSDAFDQLAQTMQRHPLDFVQLNYSLLEPEAERTLLPLAAERGIAVLVNRPFARGQLFRKTRGRALPAWAAEFDCASWAQFFLKFVLSHPAVTCAIPATSDPRHLRDNMGAGLGRLPERAQREKMLALVQAL